MGKARTQADKAASAVAAQAPCLLAAIIVLKLSKMVELERSDEPIQDRPRGTWKPLRLAEGGESATVCCPRCGQVATLEDHTIAPNGDVGPSVVCPWPIQCGNCDWHDTIRLLGWTEYWQKQKEKLT